MMEGIDWGDRKRPAVPFATPEKPTKQSRTGGKFRVTGLVQPGTSASMMSLRYNDEVHRSIDFCPLMQKMMDTWPVQRLRGIKQLGTTFLVYACANHTRFEHSVGVAYLAQEMGKRLQARYKMFHVTDKDVLCVTLAGLLHDVGHGPFSHLYEEFRSEVNADLKRHSELNKKYEQFEPLSEAQLQETHEDSSLRMVDAALESLGLAIDYDNLDQPLRQIGDGIDANAIRCYWGDWEDDENVLTNRDWIFIKECIYGKPLKNFESRIGRTDPKLEWLYDIVSNRHNGIDVDKVDYFARDERRTMGEAGNIDISIINEACIARAKCSDKNCNLCKHDKLHYQICYPKKCVSRVIEFFKTRGRLHEYVYQHKAGGAAASVLMDLLKLADPYYLIPTSIPGVGIPISRAFTDSHAFEHLTDSVVDGIMNSTSPELAPARELARKFRRRELYKLGGEFVVNMHKRLHKDLWQKAKKEPGVVAREICSVDPRHTNVDPLVEEDIIVKSCSWHQGQKDKNPALFVRFVEKSIPTYSKRRGEEEVPMAVAISDEDYQMLTTREFEKRVVRVYCRDPRKADLLAHAFEAYLERCLRGVPNSTPAPAVNFGGLHFEENEASDDESNDTSRICPVQLTQESGDEGPMTPTKSPRGLNRFASPEIKLYAKK